MDKNERKHLTIFGLLYAFYLTYKLKLDLNIMIAALFVRIELNHQDLIALGVKQGGDNSGVAQDKGDKKLILVLLMLQTAGPARAYYLLHGNKEKANKLKFTKAKLLNMNGEELIQVATSMVDDLTLDILLLVPSGVDAAKLAKVTIAIDAFTLDLNKPLEKIKTKVGFTEQIAILDKENYSLVDIDLKEAMKFYMTTDPALYSEFLRNTKAPKVGVRKHYGKRVVKSQVKIIILHDLTSEPEQGIQIKYVGIRGTFITDENGVSIAQLPIGANMGKIVAVDFNNYNFAFTLTEDGYEIIIRLIPSGV